MTPKSYNEILRDMLFAHISPHSLPDLSHGSVLMELIMPHHPADRLTYFLIKLQLVTPAATRVYLKANASRDVSFFIFRYAHNYGIL